MSEESAYAQPEVQPDIKVNLQIIPCKKCTGKMGTKIFKTHSKILTLGIISIAVLLCLTIVGSIIGVPLVIFGIHLGSKQEYYWVCDKCGLRVRKRR